jgi:hypothetical protein
MSPSSLLIIALIEVFTYGSYLLWDNNYYVIKLALMMPTNLFLWQTLSKPPEKNMRWLKKYYYLIRYIPFYQSSLYIRTE